MLTRPMVLYEVCINVISVRRTCTVMQKKQREKKYYLFVRQAPQVHLNFSIWHYTHTVEQLIIILTRLALLPSSAKILCSTISVCKCDGGYCSQFEHNAHFYPVKTIQYKIIWASIRLLHTTCSLSLFFKISAHSIERVGDG